jgi:hypothetical protein
VLRDLVELTGLLFHNAAHTKYDVHSVQTKYEEYGVLNERKDEWWLGKDLEGSN